MTKCPRCFLALHPDEFAWTEKNPDRPTRDATASQYAGKDVFAGEVRHVRRPPNASADWTPYPAGVTEPVVELCPTCHYELPPYWRWADATCIAMAGARYTGKTVYIAVLVKQLQKYVERFNQEVLPADEATRRRYDAIYEQPLFVERGIVQATPAAETDAHPPPLIFNLGFWNDQQRYLVIRDVAGEDLENAMTDGVAWQFFGLADAVLFLFDPLRVEEVGAQLRDLIPDSARVGGDPHEVLRTVMRLIGEGNPKIAMILSKFDALQALSSVRHSSWGRIMAHPGAAFNRDPGLVDTRYDAEDGLLLDAEVQSLLQKLNAGAGVRTVRNPTTGQQYEHRFFAVSALGDSPVGTKLHRNGISPFRCMDPVRWVLADRQVLQG